MATNEQMKHGFTVMYEKDGWYWGSYDLFPSADDVKLIKVAVWRGHEEPSDLGDNLTVAAQLRLLNEEF